MSHHPSLAQIRLKLIEIEHELDNTRSALTHHTGMPLNTPTPEETGARIAIAHLKVAKDWIDYAHRALEPNDDG